VLVKLTKLAEGAAFPQDGARKVFPDLVDLPQPDPNTPAFPTWCVSTPQTSSGLDTEAVLAAVDVY
jgi:hypothetical protein